MSTGIRIDWFGSGARVRGHARLPRLPAGAVRPTGLDIDPGVDGGSARTGDDVEPGGRRSEAVARFPSPPTRLRRLDRLALELRVAHDRLALPLARAAAAFLAAKAWRPCGAARLEDHARERFGRTARWVRQWADLGGALARCPELACALTGDDGGMPLGAEAARLVARVVARVVVANADAAGDAPLAWWIARAREVPLRVLRAEVRAVLAGDARDAGDANDANVAVESEAEGAAEGGFAKVAARAGDVTGDPDLDDEPRCIVEFRLPASIRAAFDEVVDLHRARAGRDGSLAEAIDALLAESVSGSLAFVLADRPGTSGVFGAPGTVRATTADRGGSDALGVARRPAGRHRVRDPRREERLERAAARWASLAPPTPSEFPPRRDDLLRRAEASLAEFRLLDACTGHGGPLALDDQIRRLVALEDTLMRRLGEIVLEFSRRGAWATLGFAGIGHYAEARLGLPATVLEDRVAVARRLARFPLLRDAYDRGLLGLDALLVVLRTLGRGPVPDDVELAWLARAREATVKRLRDEARALGRRDLELTPEATDGSLHPDCLAAVDGSLHPDCLVAADGELPGDRAELTGGRAPTNAQPLAHGRIPAGRRAPPLPLSDATWAASLRRAPGVARRRVLQAGLLALEPGPDVFLRLPLPESLADDLLAAVETARRGLTALADSVPWDRAWPDEPALPSVLAARMFSVRARRAPAWVGLLALLEEAALAWDDPRAFPERAADPIYRRDGFRCAAPGCTARATIEEHHVVFRSRGGSDDPANRVALCATHHAALHEHGTLAVSGKAPLGLTWTTGAAPAGRRYRCERRLSETRSSKSRTGVIQRSVVVDLHAGLTW